ncbi:MAG: MFS transporter [Syntrophus sp. (in: bacteria)]|nr:MFS transporter [Syntrophus sp. (in: bacteria)]
MIFYLVIIATLINQIAFKGSKVLMSLYAMNLGADPFIVGVLISLYSLFPLFLAVYAGRLSDRLGPRIPMLLGSLGLAGGLLLPFLLPRLATLLVSAAIIGCLYIFYTVSVQHLIGSFGSGEQRTRNFSTFSLGVAVSAMFGPTLAGFSIDLAGYELTYLILALFPAAPAVFFMFFARELPRAEAANQQAQKHTIDLLRNVPLRRALVTAGVIETGLELFNFYMPIYGHSLGLSASVIGIIMGAFAAAMLLMRIAMPIMVRRSSEETTLFGSLGLAAAICVLFPFVSDVYLLVGISFVLGLGLGCCSPLSLIITYNRAPDGRSGEAMGMRQTVNKFIQVLLPLIVGTLGSAFGVGPAFWLNSLMLASGAYIMKADALLRVKARQADQTGV